MTRSNVLLLFLAVGFVWFGSDTSYAQETAEDKSIHELRAALSSIRPYLPVKQVQSEIDVFGSTSMDGLAHGWANGFKQFHPDAQVVISAEGSESVFERLAKNPASIGMLSRPVTDKDLESLKAAGLKEPVAVMVGRDALGVFVHQSNPLESISYAELVKLFCQDSEEKPVTWAAVGATGEFAQTAVVRLGRKSSSGTRTFVKDYVFAGKQLLATDVEAETNAKLMAELDKQPAGIMISDLKCGVHNAKLLQLRANKQLVPSDDHAILLGRYPLIRPLTLVFDMGQADSATDANREFVRFALGHAGQVQSILSGFFPFDPPTLRGELAKVDFQNHTGSQPPSTQERQGAQAKTEAGDSRIKR